jgi:hypothetical protein
MREADGARIFPGSIGFFRVIYIKIRNKKTNPKNLNREKTIKIGP